MSSFPASKYVRYKRATAIFLNWLLRARGHRRHGSKRLQLEALHDVVEEVAAQPSTLTPALLKDFPKALAACQCAITLREHVAAFFADAEHGHQHFLELLRSWLNTLNTVSVEPQQQQQEDDGGTAVKLESAKFENYYEVLDVDDDFFPDEGTYVAEPTASKGFKVDRQRLLDEAFAEDMRLEVVYLFVELEELVQEVFNVYEQVKKRQRTMVEATVAVKLALDIANGLAATLQLRYPSLRTARDFFDVIVTSDSEGLSFRMITAYRATSDSLQQDGVYKFVPDMFLLDFLSVGSTLDAFVSMIPPNLHYNISLPPDFYGESYDEARTPHYLLPDMNNMVIFLQQHLPVLFNTVAYTKITTFNSYESTEVPDWKLAGSFMNVMDKYFTVHEVTVSTVFACICWLKSVAALQGNGDLSRNTVLTLNHTADLANKFDAIVAEGAVLAADKQLHGFYKSYAEDIKISSGQNNHLVPTNPLIAGFLMLDHHFEYLDLASEVVATTSKLRAFGHLYNALVNEGFMDRLPFFEKLLDIYKQMIFTPSRAAAVRGGYYRTYLLSSDLKATALEAALRGDHAANGTDIIKLRALFRLKHVSNIFRLMLKDDKSFLGGNSLKALIARAVDICSEELFETRVLSRDMLKFHDDLSDMFSEMCELLGERWMRGAADEDEVTGRVVRILDVLQPNGELDLNQLPGGGNSHRRFNRMNGEPVRAMCSKFASVIESKFAIPPVDLENRYYIFSTSLGMEKQPCGQFCQERSSNTETARSDEAQHTNARTSEKPRRKKKKKNKKKNKRNKNDNVKGNTDTGTTNVALQLDENDGSAEVTTMLRQLLVSAGWDIDPKGDDQASVAVLEDSLRKKATTAFDRLRDPSVPVHHKTGDVQHACRVIQKLNGLVKEFTSPGKISTTDRHLQNTIFSEASHIIFMMQRLHRTDHPYIKAPALTPVRDLCDTCPEFTQFVVATARIGVSINKKQQARAILDLLEKRFLKLRFQRAKLSCFRELVHTYSEARDEMGLGQTSNTDSFRALEWYLTPTLDDYQAQINLDGMDGQPFYFELVTTAFQDTSKFERALAMVPGIACYGDSVKRIVYGGPKELLNRGRKLVVAVAKAEGVRLSERNSQKCMTSFRVGEFVFSAAGVCRDTAAA